MNISIYKNLEEILMKVKKIIDKEKFDELKGLFEQKAREPQVKVLLYGPYNSGKTTLINALAGEELFKVGPIPETMELQPKSFGEYEIIDSPGFNAPTPEAEELSKKCARWDADLVIIVSSIPYLQDEKLWQECEELLLTGKDVFIVGNMKEEINEQQIEDIKDNVYSKKARIQTKFKKKTGEIYGPYFLNALSAFNARTSRPKKQALEMKSGIQFFQREIQNYVMENKNLSGAITIANNISHYLEDKKEEIIKEVTKNNEHGVTIREAIKKVEGLKKDFEEFIDRMVDSSLKNLEILANKIVWGELNDNDIFKNEIVKEIKNMGRKSNEHFNLLLQNVRYELRTIGVDPLIISHEFEKELQELLHVEDMPAESPNVKNQSSTSKTNDDIYPQREYYSNLSGPSPSIIGPIGISSLLNLKLIENVTELEFKNALTLNKVTSAVGNNTAKKLAIGGAKQSGKLLKITKVAGYALIAITSIWDIKRNYEAMEMERKRIEQEAKKQEKMIQKMRELSEHRKKMESKRRIEYVLLVIKRYYFEILNQIEDKIRDKLSELKNFSEDQQKLLKDISDIESEIQDIMDLIKR